MIKFALALINFSRCYDMKNTTLCYIERDGKYLMLYRNKKKNDINGGKYIGVGGHFEKNETAYDCVIREVKEETGLDLINPVYRGEITFVSNNCESEIMHLFTCDTFIGEPCECNEGELVWIEKSKIEELPMWSGDIYFLRKLTRPSDFFTMKLVYEDDTLIEYYFNNEKQSI